MELFKVTIELKNFMITVVAIVLAGWLSSAFLTTFIPSLFGMFVYNDFTKRVTSKQLFGMLFTYSSFFDLILQIYIFKIIKR